MTCGNARVGRSMIAWRNCTRIARAGSPAVLPAHTGADRAPRSATAARRASGSTRFAPQSAASGMAPATAPAFAPYGPTARMASPLAGLAQSPIPLPRGNLPHHRPASGRSVDDNSRLGCSPRVRSSRVTPPSMNYRPPRHWIAHFRPRFGRSSERSHHRRTA